MSELAIPAALVPFVQKPCLLPGEDQRAFEAIRQMILDDVRPNTAIEWLWALDIVELSWEILRYRSLKQRILEEFRVMAVESLLRRMDGSGMGDSDLDQTIQRHARRSALEWRYDSDAATEIEARLKRFGFDARALNAEIYVQAQSQLEMFDQLAQRAQQRRMGLLREISIRRELVMRAERVSDAVIRDGGVVLSRRRLKGGKRGVEFLR